MDNDTPRASSAGTKISSAKAPSDESKPVSSSSPAEGDRKEGKGSGGNVAPQFEDLIPNVKIRDFAYPSNDPRHYGHPLPTPDTSSSESDDDGSDTGYRSAERLFESDESDHDHAHSHHHHKKHHRIRPADVDTFIFPALTKELNDVGGGKMKVKEFYRAKAMFDFKRVTEWEMTIREGDDVVVVVGEKIGGAVKKNEEEEGGRSRELGSDVQLRDSTTERGKTGVVEEKKSSTTTSGESKTANTTTQHAQSLPSLSITSDATNATLTSTQSLKPTQQTTQQTPTQKPKSTTDLPTSTAPSDGRWASIDDLDSPPSTSLSNISAISKNDLSSSSATSAPAVQLSLDPDAKTVVEQMGSVVEYEGVYGEGWVTAVRFRFRGSVGGEGQGGGGRVRVRIVDLGLVPGNYIERC
ncbi:hypothetical protein HDV00_008073 [Rhizophlyctis rosea]|nr:hypothetical protein HDV00_008073 [Rhizophlyctis rosea]